MQQFTVPQFIDVESKIIGPITVRQFIIFLIAGIIIALSYRLFDFTLFLVISFSLGILAIVFAFVKINGQHFHIFFLSLTQTLRRPKIRTWNNRLTPLEDQTDFLTPPPPQNTVAPKMFKASRLAELALIVDTKGKYKGE